MPITRLFAILEFFPDFVDFLVMHLETLKNALSMIPVTSLIILVSLNNGKVLFKQEKMKFRLENFELVIMLFNSYAISSCNVRQLYHGVLFKDKISRS